MKRRLVWLVSIAIAATTCMGLVACGTSAPTDEPKEDVVESTGNTDNTTTTDTTEQTEKPHGVAINLSDNSILTFDDNAAAAQLVEDMRAGKTPKSCTVRYDQMGALPTVTVTDARTIRNVYKKLARMHVEGPSNTSMTDSYHLVMFELQDGTKVAYNFEGAGILVREDQNYAVTDDGHLWEYVQELQEQYLEEQKAGPDSLAITLEDDQEMVAKCPKSAKAGETVRIEVYSVEDAERHVAINGDEFYGDFVSAEEFEFVMPDTPVTVHVWIGTNGYAGA